MPCHLDHLIGAARAATSLDGGRIDGVLGTFRALGVYHAAASLGRAAEQATRWNDVEHELGLSRTYQVEIANASDSEKMVDRLRSLPAVESARVQTLATAPFSAAVAAEPASTHAAWAPHERIHAPEAHRIEPGDERSRSGSSTPGSRSAIPSSGASCSPATTPSTSASTRPRGYASRRLRGDDFTPADAVGHGTHVGGIVGATGWDLPPGVAGLSLMAPVRVLAAALAGTRRARRESAPRRTSTRASRFASTSAPSS